MNFYAAALFCTENTTPSANIMFVDLLFMNKNVISCHFYHNFVKTP